MLALRLLLLFLPCVQQAAASKKKEARAKEDHRFVLVLHATTESAVQSAASVVRQLEREAQSAWYSKLETTLWVSQGLEVRSLEEKIVVKPYAEEVERRGLAARAALGLAVALEGSGPSPTTLLSLDLDNWRICRRFAVALHSKDGGLPLKVGPREEEDETRGGAVTPDPPALLAMAEARREGHSHSAELTVFAATWKRSIWVRRYAAGMKYALKRDAKTPPMSWLANSSATDVAFEAKHKVLQQAGDLDFVALPESLACRGKCEDDKRCLGSARKNRAFSTPLDQEQYLRRRKLIAEKTEALLGKILGEGRAKERADKCIVRSDNVSSLDAKGDRSRRRPPPGGELLLRREVEVVVVSGVNAREGPNGDADVDLALSKRVYAERHGYAFAFYAADTFNEALLANSAKDGKPLPWEFAKILMIRDAAHAYPGARWICWIDADAWINPLFAHLPLGLWLDATPRDRLAVVSNFRGFNTGVVAIRGGARGRTLVAQWLAVARSGLAQCHPHDQAAFQMLQLWHLNGSKAEERFPFGFDCRKTDASCGAHPDGQPSKHWSCIPLWLNAVKRAHDTIGAFSHLRPEADATSAKRRPRYPDVADVIDRADANPEIAPFYVAAENRHRPRLQCFRCVLGLDKLERYPGKNFPRKNPQADQDGWLVDHKGQSLFYQKAFHTQSHDPQRPCFVNPKTVTHFKA